MVIELLSKEEIIKVEPKKEKPPLIDGGFLESLSLVKLDKMNPYAFILSNMPNLYKERCVKLIAKQKNARIKKIKKPGVLNPGNLKSKDSHKSEDRSTDTSSLSDLSNFYNEIGKSMSQRFIKYQPCEKSAWLRKHYPNAYLLLSLIAERARRTNHNIDGLIIGDAIIARKEASSACGITIDKYRTAIKKLVEFGLIEIVVNTSIREKVQKRPTKIPTKSMIVNLLDSEVWDINPESDPHQNPHPIPTSSPPDPHKQERRRTKKNVKETNDIARSPLSLKKEISENEQLEIDFFWKILNQCSMCEGQPIEATGVKETDLLQWVRKYSHELILEALKMTQNKTNLKSYPAYIGKLLRDKIPENNTNLGTGKKYVSDIVKEHNLKNIEIQQQYFTDILTKNKMPYSLPQVTLEVMMKKIVERDTKDLEDSSSEDNPWR